MDLWKLLIVILALVIVYLLLGGSARVAGGRERKSAKVAKKSAKKLAKKPEKEESEEKMEKPEKRAKPERQPGDPFEITESEQCVKRAKAGEKSVVARLQAPYFDEMNEGDKIILKSKEGDSVEKKLVSKHKYGSFKEMFEKEGLENVFPGSSGIDAAIEHYRQFYSEEKEKERGVIALRFE